MKLSMWMIANRLRALEPELHIRNNAPAILNSARTVYATNCVHCYQEGNKIICKGEGDYIVLTDITLTQTFEIIQSVFDFYEDWLDTILKKIDESAYQDVVDLLWSVIQNPINLLDSDHCVLGITRNQYPIDSIDHEWNYLLTYGFVSVQSMQLRHLKQTGQLHETSRLYSVANKDFSYINRPVMSFTMKNREEPCGYLNILPHDRDLNSGDRQLLDLVGKYLELHFIKQGHNDDSAHSLVFLDLLLNRPYYEKRLYLQLNYMNWAMDDTYSLIMIRVDRKQGQFSGNEIKSLKRLIEINAKNILALDIQKSNELLVLCNTHYEENTQLMTLLKKLAKIEPILIGYSLHCHQITKINHLYDQARAAINLGNMHGDDTSHRFFKDYAVDHIVMSGGIESNLFSCMPAIHELWFEEQSSDSSFLDTLNCYLKQNGSVVGTAKALFAHRNTIQYRLKRIEEVLNCDLDDSYIREYLMISIRIMKLYELKYGSKKLLEELQLH